MEEKFQPKYNRFMRLKCDSCGNEQVTFNCASKKVTCNVCNLVIAEPTGHRLKAKGSKILREY